MTSTFADYYFFAESISKKVNTSKLLFEYRQDEPLFDEELRPQIQFVSDEVGFVWLGNSFGVSIDGGTEWKVTDLRRDSAFGRTRALRGISEVRIDTNGVGVMFFSQHELYPEQPFFTTSDFGITWIDHSKEKQVQNNRNLGVAR